MRVFDFIAGTALGSVPKIALTAFAGASVMHAMNGGGVGRWLSLAGVAAVWVGTALAARAWLKRKEAEDWRGEAEGGEVDPFVPLIPAKAGTQIIRRQPFGD
jgi:hypothetical protein